MSSPIRSIDEEPATRTRISSLLLRYPDLSENELSEMIEFYRTASALDTALIASNDKISAQAKQFCSDHRDALKRGLQAPLVLLIFILGMLTIAVGFALQLN